MRNALIKAILRCLVIILLVYLLYMQFKNNNYIALEGDLSYYTFCV
jgi:hypothetical protein